MFVDFDEFGEYEEPVSGADEAEPESGDRLPVVDEPWLYDALADAAEHSWLSAKPVTHARNADTVICVGVVAPLDLVRALHLHAPLLAEDAAVNRERAALVASAAI